MQAKHVACRSSLKLVCILALNTKQICDLIVKTVNQLKVLQLSSCAEQLDKACQLTQDLTA